MISVYTFIFYVGLVAASVMLVKHGIQLYKNRKKGTELPEDWGSAVCFYVGFSLFALYQVLPSFYLAKFHGMLAFVGINLMLAAALSRFRYFGKYGKSKPDPNLHGPKKPLRIPNR